MKFSRAVLSAPLAALFGVVAADLQVISPGGSNLWWVAGSINTLAWNCQSTTVTDFTVLIANSDPKILPAPLALIAQENNFDCSKTITEQQSAQTPAQGYTILLANPLNNTDVYATSQPFEIKPLGSSYPATTATPSGTAAASGSAASGGATSGNATGTAAGANASASSTGSTKSSASTIKATLTGISAIGAVVVGLIMA